MQLRELPSLYAMHRHIGSQFRRPRGIDRYLAANIEAARKLEIQFASWSVNEDRLFAQHEVASRHCAVAFANGGAHALARVHEETSNVVESQAEVTLLAG